MKRLWPLMVLVATVAACSGFLVAPIAIGRSPSDNVQYLTSFGLALAFILWVVRGCPIGTADPLLRLRIPGGDLLPRVAGLVRPLVARLEGFAHPDCPGRAHAVAIGLVPGGLGRPLRTGVTSCPGGPDSSERIRPPDRSSRDHMLRNRIAILAAVISLTTRARSSPAVAQVPRERRLRSEVPCRRPQAPAVSDADPSRRGGSKGSCSASPTRPRKKRRSRRSRVEKSSP